MTFLRTFSSAPPSLRFSSASATSSAISSISSSFMPRVVTAGVPTRMPAGLKGELVSNGMAFLFTVMLERSRTSCASLPLRSFGRRRSEERRVGKECRSRGSAYHLKSKKDGGEGGRDGGTRRRDAVESAEVWVADGVLLTWALDDGGGLSFITWCKMFLAQCSPC